MKVSEKVVEINVNHILIAMVRTSAFVIVVIVFVIRIAMSTNISVTY